MKGKMNGKMKGVLLIAVLLITTIPIVMAADYTGYFGGQTNTWSQDDSKIGDWSVEIDWVGLGNDWVVIPVNMKLSEITSKDSNYWFKLVTTDDPSGPDYPNYGEVVLLIDVDDDESYDHGIAGTGGDDYLFGEWVYYDTGVSGDSVPIATHDWVQLDLNDPLLGFWDRYVGSHAPGDDLRPLSWFADNDDTGGTGDERILDGPEQEAGTDGVDITGDSVVLYVVIQSWAGYEAYIDDVTMGGKLFPLEPVAFDAEYYHLGDTVTLTVVDEYKNTNPLVKEIISPITVTNSLSYLVDVALTETGIDTGIFSGTFKLVDYTPGTAELLITDGCTFGLTYDSATILATVDDTAPVVEITDPEDLDFVTGASVTIDITTPTDVNEDTVILEIDGEVILVGEVPAGLPYTWDTTFEEVLDVPDWPDGAYTITVTATDFIGHTTYDSISVTVDNTDPEITNEMVSPTTVLPATAETFVFTAEPSDAGSGIDTVTINLGTLGGGGTVSMLDDGVDPDVTALDGIYTTSYDTTGLSATQYTVTITATDEVGNSLVTDPITIVSSTDLVKPVITGESITYPVGVVSARPGDEVVISATITDAEGIDTVTISDALVVPLMNGVLMTGVDDVYTWDAALANYPIGSYVLTITATDENANEETATVTLEVTTDLTGLYVDLEEGWNMFSLPLIPDDSSIEVVLAGVMENVTIVLSLGEGGWLTYLPAVPEYSTLFDMEDGKGYWIQMTDASLLTVNGVELPGPGIIPPVYDVSEGWNLIGYKEVGPMKINDYIATIPALVRDSSVSYGWDATAQAYEMVYLAGKEVPLTTRLFMPGQGYWLYLTEDAGIAPPEYVPVP